MKSSVFAAEFQAGSTWIPVAAVDQKTTISDGDKINTISLSKESLESNLKGWTGGYINVNHEDNGEIEGLKIEAAKFEDDLLYFKVNQKLAEFIQNTASTGRSIEIDKMNIVDNVVMSKPACTADMGCSATPLDTSGSSGAIKTIFLKLADKLKSQSFMDSMTETAGTDPNLEQTMTEETDKLKFGKMEADKSRDEALEEIKTLKFSLVEKETILTEKDSIISDKDTLITEQTERLKFYADAEVKAAEKLKDDQWETLKSSIPPGKFHKPEDEAALKQEFTDDPATFAVKMATFEKVAPTTESGAEFTAGTGSDEAEDLKAIDEFNQRVGA